MHVVNDQFIIYILLNFKSKKIRLIVKSKVKKIKMNLYEASTSRFSKYVETE